MPSINLMDSATCTPLLGTRTLVNMVEDPYFKATHYNLKCKPGARLNRITAHDFRGIKPQDIEWIWTVEENRSATSEEILELCKRAPER